MDNQPPIGAIPWCDLTVPDATAVSHFYQAVVGWRLDPLPMGEYDDYCMAVADTGQVVAGICHQRGLNANLPPQWLIYIEVADLERSLEQCVALGGEVLTSVQPMQDHRFAVIRDPAGAVCALYCRRPKTEA